MDNSSVDVIHTLNTPKSGGSKKRSKFIAILIVAIFILTIVTAIALYIKSTIPARDIIREEQIATYEVQDLYQGQPLEIVEPYLVRARFAKLEGNVLTYGVFSPVGAQTTEVQLGDRTAYGCTPRYMTAPDGTKIDRLGMLVTTHGKEVTDMPDPPNAKDLEWFKGNAQNGEAVEIRFIKTEDGSVIPRIIYVYQESC